MRIANKRNRGAGRKAGTRIMGRNHTAGLLIGSGAGTSATRQLLAQSIERFHELHPLCEKSGPEPTQPDLTKNTRTNAARRGSTVDSRRQTRQGLASPARRGSTVVGQRRTREGRSLPRARGDAPHMSRSPRTHHRAAPRARGCTQGFSGPPTFLRGCPARAGMHRTGLSVRMSRIRLPRTRGDAPSVPARHSSVKASPPHARG